MRESVSLTGVPIEVSRFGVNRGVSDSEIFGFAKSKRLVFPTLVE